MVCGGIFPFFNWGRDDKAKCCGLGACGCGSCGCDSCGCGCKKDDPKRVAVITAIRAVLANGDGSFDKVGEW